MGVESRKPVSVASARIRNMYALLNEAYAEETAGREVTGSDRAVVFDREDTCLGSGSFILTRSKPRYYNLG